MYAIMKVVAFHSPSMYFYKNKLVKHVHKSCFSVWMEVGGAGNEWSKF